MTTTTTTNDLYQTRRTDMARKELSYHDVYDVIATYAGRELPMFADGWNRFPVGNIARHLVAALRAQEKFWTGRGDGSVARLIGAAADEIERRA